jgi:hypothetical protein
MSKIFKSFGFLVVIAVIASLVLGAPTCTVIANMVKVANGNLPGSFIMSSFDDSQFMLSWPYRGGYQLVFLNRNGVPLLNAPLTQNTIAASTMVDLVNGSFRAGWRQITATQLPPQVKLALVSYVAAFGNFAWQTYPTFFVVPMGVLDVDQVIPNAVEIQQ